MPGGHTLHDISVIPVASIKSPNKNNLFRIA